MTRCRIAIALLILAWSVPAWAHTIILRNGQVIYGEVVQQDRQSIYVAMKGGKKTFLKATVLKILFQEVKEETAIKRIIRAEIARQQPASTEEDIKIVDFNDYMKEVIAEEGQRRTQDTRRGALWRSALLPGWGQWHVDRPGRGSTYAGLFVAATAARLAFYRQNQQAVADYKDLTLPFLSYSLLPRDIDVPVRYAYYAPIKERMQTSHDNARRASIAMALVWTISMLDAAFSAPAPAADSAAAYRPRIDLIVTPATRRGEAGPHLQDGAGISLTMAF